MHQFRLKFRFEVALVVIHPGSYFQEEDQDKDKEGDAEMYWSVKHLMGSCGTEKSEFAG